MGVFMGAWLGNILKNLTLMVVSTRQCSRGGKIAQHKLWQDEHELKKIFI